MPIEIRRRDFLSGIGGSIIALPLLKCSPVNRGRPCISNERLKEIVSNFHKHSLFNKVDSMFLNQFRPWYMEESLNALKKVKSEVPELEDLSVIDITESYLRGEDERLKRLENQGSHETLNEWGSFFDLHKVLSVVRLAVRYGSESKNKLVRDVTSLLTTSPASDAKLALVTISLRRALEAENIRRAEIDSKIKKMLSERRRERGIA